MKKRREKPTLDGQIFKYMIIDSKSKHDSSKAVKEEVKKELKEEQVHEIQVVGIPPSIELIGPSEIKLVMPDKPEIELVYKGAPIDVKINLDISRLTGEDGNAQCVTIVPCKTS